ncbi:MAG: TetR/AcrR family transcriptional regulator [Anaerolineae bacterium]|nr:TetR/AcrR family transcriptional regulator [Anaerolineae bacterium]
MLKDQIADVFQRHFHQFGFKKTSVDDIAHEMQISKKTIYQHFLSKEDIFEFIVHRNAQSVLSDLVKQLPDENNEMARLERLIHLIHALARDFRREINNFETQFKMEIAEKAYQEAYSLLIADLITRGVEKKEFHCSNLPATIRFVNVIIAESVHLAFSEPSLDPAEQAVVVIKKILS